MYLAACYHLPSNQPAYHHDGPSNSIHLPLLEEDADAALIGNSKGIIPTQYNGSEWDRILQNHNELLKGEDLQFIFLSALNLLET